MNKNLLIAYVSTDGQTGKIARYLADGMEHYGYTVTLRDVSTIAIMRDISGFDRYYICGSIRRGRHSRALARFVRRYREQLEPRRSVFFSVSAAAADREYLGEARRYVENFLRRVNWRPGHYMCIAGAVLYTQYGVITRALMKRIFARYGGPTDTSCDHELTDWTALDRFLAADSHRCSDTARQRAA